MALKKSSGNMYEFVTHLWTPIRGKCSHDCSYCYMKRWGNQPPLHLDEKEMRTDLGIGNFIFVCHTCDMFAEDVHIEWIERVLRRLRLKTQNKYLLQSKNPKRFTGFLGLYPVDVLFGTTIETNRDIVQTKAPPVKERAQELYHLKTLGYHTMVTIEPIFDFDLDELVWLIMLAKPDWVNLGADSKGHNLPEPPVEKVRELIRVLKKNTAVKIKGNLKRLMGD